MAEKNYQPAKYVDFISSFEAGMQSGVSPLLLPKNQVAVAINASIRGGYIHPRAPFVKKTLTFGGKVTTANLVQGGYFQGAGYYRPDFGTELLLAAISGHLFTLTEQSTNGPWAVVDVSLPNDLNSSSQQQTWMWQSEKWMIVSDGSAKNPIFFDGVSSRRSFGPSQTLGTGIAFDPDSPPAIGQAVQVTLEEPYTGPLNISVIFNSEFYQVTSNPAGYQAVLTNVSDIPGNTVSAGVDVIFNPQIAFIGVDDGGGVAGDFDWIEGGPQSDLGASIAADSFAGLAVGDGLTFQVAGTTYTFVVGALDGPATNSAGLNFVNGTPTGPDKGFGYAQVVPLGTEVLFSGVTAPSVVVGITNQDFVVPAVGSTVTVTLNQPYGGNPNERVSINGAWYTIAAVGGNASGTIIFLINNTDTSTSPYVNPSDILSVPEIPAARMGTYGNGRNWFSLTNGVNYEAGDIVGSGSGSPAYNFRDSVLKTTENDFLANGGTFNLPGTGDIITALIFPPVLDTSLGVGQLQIFTPFSAFANNAPADRNTWANLSWPIQTETLKDQGALAQDSTVLVNSDVFFRSDFNIASLILARRQFGDSEWGNKPIANEMQRILKLDNQTLLQFGTSVSFDNRFLHCCVPNAVTQGVFHSGVISLNFDLVSSLRTRLPAAWEGAWSGINVMKLITGRVNGMRRCFAFSFNITDNRIELYELLSEAAAIQAGIYNDNNTTPIGWFFETAALFQKDIHNPTELIQLRDGELQISNIVGTVTVKAYYKPDYYPCWTLWREFNLCADMSGANANATYHMRVGLGEPDSTVSNLTRPMRIGRFFQFRFEITGYCQINGFQASAISTPEPVYSPVNTPTTCQAIDCVVPADLTIYSLQGLPPQPPPPPVPPAATFKNEAVFFAGNCPSGQVLNYTGSGLPPWVTIDQANDRLIGAAGTFTGATQLAANTAAQNALNSFAVAQAQLGNLACGSFVCPPSANSLAIASYADGLIPVSGGVMGGAPTWDGTFTFFNSEACVWFGWVQNDEQPGEAQINGHQCRCAEIVFTNPFFFLRIYDQSNSGTLAWEGQLNATFPTGVYLNTNGGYLATPDSVTVVDLGTPASIQTFGPSCQLD